MLSLLLKKDEAKKVVSGYPWIFKSMIEMTSELEMAENGEIVKICDNRAKPIAIGYINPNTMLACRILSLNPKSEINKHFFYGLFKTALEKRQKIFNQPYYRLVHSDSDSLPGLIIDRFSNTIVCQTSTAGMENLKPIWLNALEELIKPECVVFRDDIPARKKEGLETKVSVYKGSVPELVEVREFNTVYYSNLLTGQKTGWFYDQRANRQYVAGLVNGKTMLDLYSHSGGFGLPAALAGAKAVSIVDSSSLALDLSRKASEKNGVSSVCNFIRSDAYEYLEKAAHTGVTFDVVMADPPAFVKEKKHKSSGLKGYQKLAYLCAKVVEKDGYFCIASCSHHASPYEFQKAVEDGISKAGREFKLLTKMGADKDHPIHPKLPETGYLKFLSYKLHK